MNALLRAAIDAGLADLDRVMDAPTGALGYGTDIVWTSDLVEPMSDVDPTSTAAISQALIRRLDCPRGRLVDDADYGLDVRGYLNRGTTTAEINALAGAIRNEVEKDDRVVSATVTVSPSSTGDAFAVSIRIVPASSERDTFTVTLAVTSSALVLQEITG